MTELHLIIGNKNYSSWSLRAWLAMKQFQIPFEETVIALDTEQAREQKLRHAPSGRVPILRDGDITVWDSLAICEHLAERFPDCRMWPTSVKGRARARSICAEMHSGFTALRTELPMNCRARRPRCDRSPAVVADVRRIVECWSDTRREFAGEGAFLFGRFTLADAFFAPVASRFFTYDVELDEVANSYVGALFALPALQQWMVEAENEPMTLPHVDQVR